MTSSLGFKARVDSLACCASPPVCNRFLRFISGATPADSLAVSMAAERFRPGTFVKAGARVYDQACCCLTACDQTDAFGYCTQEVKKLSDSKTLPCVLR